MNIPDHIGHNSYGAPILLHDDAVTQGFAILAMRDSGKSNTAGVMQEVFASRGDQFIVLDPPGAHIGIRNAQDKDGKPAGPSGLNVMVIGGDNADLPFDPHSGVALAQTLMDTKMSCVINLREARMRERRQFLVDFGEELYRKNKTPLHIFLEEADEIIPQQLDSKDEMAVRGIWRKIIKGGRQSGLGFTIITQRAAMVDKTSLTQIENLFVMSLMGSADLDAIAHWFKVFYKDKDQWQEVIRSIPSLSKGECWFLSPRWLRETVRLKVRRRVTYHAGRTPKKGEAAPEVKRYAIGEVVERVRSLLEEKGAQVRTEAEEVGHLRSLVGGLEEQHKQDKALLADLESQLAYLRNQPPPQPVYLKPDLLQLKPPIVAEGERILSQVEPELAAAATRVLRSAFSWFYGSLDNLLKTAPLPDSPPVEPYQVAERVTTKPIVSAETVQKAIDQHVVQNVQLPSGSVAVLQELAVYHPTWVSPKRVAVSVGVSSKKSTWRAQLAPLRKHALIEEREDGRFMRLSPAGEKYLGGAKPRPRTTADVLARWRAKLSEGAYAALEMLASRHGNYIARADVARHVGVDPSKSTWRAYLAPLRAAHLIVERQDGALAANKETLFL